MCEKYIHIIYTTKLWLWEDLEAKITDVISDIIVNKLAKNFIDLRNFITICINKDGGHEKIQ